MEAQMKSRGRAVPKSVGRPVGVLPIEPRKPLAPRAPTGASRTSAAARRVPPSRASSNTSYRSLASSRSVRSNCSAPDIDDELTDQDVQFTDVPSGASSARSLKGEEKKKVPKKTFSPFEVLEMCQEEDFNKVYEVDLHGTEITDMPDLGKFHRLRVLDVSGNHIRGIGHLLFNQDMRDLKLYDNNITVLEGLDNLKELCNLQLQHNQIQTLGKGLNNLKKLKCLRLDSNRLSKLENSELLSCVNITTLDLSNNSLTNLAPLGYLPNLEELFVSGNRLQKMSDLKKCKRLQEVDLSRNQLTDLSGIAGLPNLQILDVSDNQLQSLSSLGKLKSLEDLNVARNRVSQASGWGTSFPRLQILDLTDNMLKDWDNVCLLSSLPELVELSLAGNPVTLEDGECPTYHTDIQQVLPQLEIVDGAHIKRPTARGNAPLMRPMSASSVVSVRQVDMQMKSAEHEQEAMLKSISERFESMKSLFDSLPAQPPPPIAPRSFSSTLSSVRPPSNGVPTPASSLPPTPSSRCSRRSRIREAQAFASTIAAEDNE